jgi:Ca-activated chloride channel homolog
VRRSLLVLACVMCAAEANAQALLHPVPEVAVDQPAPNTAAAPPAATAATPADPSPVGTAGTVFRAGVDLVAFNVVVTDPQQKFVTGLAAQDFTIFEDGVRQDVSYFAASQVPLDLAILLDTSASMTDKMTTVQQAAIGFTNTLKPGDRAMIVDIKDATKIMQGLTGDLPAAANAIRATSARGGTALFNGIYLTLKELVKERRGNGDVRRQAIVVMSDGDDTASLVSFDDVMDVAKQAGISIYTITLRSKYLMQAATQSGRRYFSQSEFAMKSLAQETGARSFFPADISELAGVYGSIAEELSTQYSIGYTSKNARRDGQFRRVIVQVAEHPGVRTRTRSGYTAPRPDRVAHSTLQ